MSGICDTCRREPCHMRFDGCKTCDVYEGGETRYEKLFGTPERAARTCRNIAADDSLDEFVCSECGYVVGAYEYGPDIGEHCKGCGAKVVD